MQRNAELEGQLKATLSPPNLDFPDPAQRRASYDAWKWERSILENLLAEAGELVFLGGGTGWLPDSYLNPGNIGPGPGKAFDANSSLGRAADLEEGARKAGTLTKWHRLRDRHI